MSILPEAADKPSWDIPTTWERVRARKRDQWVSRYWKRNPVGNSYLNADGYITRIIKTGKAAWHFELQPNKSVEVVRTGGGYRTVVEARLAAFDAITELLRQDSQREG